MKGRAWRSRGLALMLAAALLGSACGGNDGSSGGSSGGQLSGDLSVWGMQLEGENMKKLAEDFMKENPDVNVQVDIISWDVAHDKLLTAVAGNETPDVSLMGTTWMGEFAENGSLAEAPDSIDDGAFFDSAWNTAVSQGTSYGIPLYIDTRVLYYRTDIAKKAGFDGPPETWSELKQMAVAMQAKGGAKYGIYMMPNNWQELLPFIWQAGGDVMTDDYQSYTFDSPEVVEALAFQKWFFDKGLIPETPPEGYDPTQPFVDGDVPMFFSGPWHVALIEDTGGKKLQGKWAVAPMPENESNTSFAGGGDLVVFNQAENQEAAWAFAEYLARPEVQANFYDLTGDLPAVEAAWERSSLEGDATRQVFRRQFVDTKVPPVIPKWEEVATGAIFPSMEKVMIGGATPEQGAQEMQAKAESIGVE
ncbi:sugar ABC transporter substrate-binding protein [soil metagenome]